MKRYINGPPPPKKAHEIYSPDITDIRKIEIETTKTVVI